MQNTWLAQVYDGQLAQWMWVNGW